MHVLQLLPRLDLGGVERGVLDLAKGLLARGHQVSVVSAGGALVDRLTQLGAKHYQLPVDKKSLVSMASCVPALTELIRTAGVDIVHARSRVPAWIGFIAARRAQRPFITTAHGFYAPHLASRVMVWGRFVIAPSAALGRYLVEQLHLPKERLRIIPRGVDLDEFTYQPHTHTHEGPWRIGLFGRLSRLKGHEVVLRACAELIRGGLPVTVCLTRQSTDSAVGRQLEALIRALTLQDAVEWSGVRQEVASLIASVDLVVVPSTYPESFGRGVTEAQAVGRPVVASRIGALPELVDDGRSGLLVPPDDASALAQALKRLIQDARLRARCVREGRRQVEHHGGLDRMLEQTLQVYEACRSQPRILVWKLSALGDVILSTPSLRAIRRQFPDGQISVVVGRAAYEVIARCPYVNDILVYDPTRKDRGLRRRLAFVKRLREGAFDLSIDLQNSRQTHLMAWLAGIAVRIGYRRKFRWCLNRGVRLPRVVLTPIAHQHYLLRKAGLTTDGDRLELWPSPLDARAAERLIPPDRAAVRRRLIGLHPGGSGRWKTKRWDLVRWARLCDALTERGCRVVITGGPEEQDLGASLIQLTASHPQVLIGQTSLMELACLIKRFDVFVAHDSSPLHLATAVGTPTVALFGPTDPARHLASTFQGQVLQKDVFCRPCYSTRCRTVTHACMKDIEVDEVLDTVLRLSGPR